MSGCFLDGRYRDRGLNYIDVDVEWFYKQGLECFLWSLPRGLTRQALKSVCAHHVDATDSPVALLHLRAFAFGLSGCCDGGRLDRLAPAGYAWPEPPDPSWDRVIFVFPDGGCEMDYLHPVSFECWSNQNDLPELPRDSRGVLTRNWFARMGFEIVVAMTDAVLATAAPGPAACHLRVVK